MANWGQLLSKFIPTRTPITRSVLGRAADPASFQQRLGQTLNRRDFMPKKQYDLDQKDIQLGSLWAKLRSISPDLFKQKSDQAAAIGKNNTGIITESLPLAPPGKTSVTGKPFQKKGGLINFASKYLGKQLQPLHMAANSATPPGLGLGTVDWAKDISKFRKGSLADGSKLPLTNSTIRNVLLPTTTGIVADQVLPTDWKQKLWSDFKSLKPMPGR